MAQVGERDRAARHLQLLTETIAAVNSTLDLAEVFAQIASKVAQAMGTDACFVYMFDESGGMLELRATHGARFDDPAHRPRMAPGEGITGAAAAAMRPIMIPRAAHLDPRFRSFPNLPEDEYESILAVPVLARDRLAGALNVRTREPRMFEPRRDRAARRRSLPRLARRSRTPSCTSARSRGWPSSRRWPTWSTLSTSLYLDDSLRGIGERRQPALRADGCAVVLRGEDGSSVAYRQGEVPGDEQLVEYRRALAGRGRARAGPAAFVEAAPHRGADHGRRRPTVRGLPRSSRF